MKEEIKGPASFNCNGKKNGCKFEEPAMNDLIGSVFGDKSIFLDCDSSECLYYTEVPGYEVLPFPSPQRSNILASRETRPYCPHRRNNLGSGRIPDPHCFPSMVLYPPVPTSRIPRRNPSPRRRNKQTNPRPHPHNPPIPQRLLPHWRKTHPPKHPRYCRPRPSPCYHGCFRRWKNFFPRYPGTEK